MPAAPNFFQMATHIMIIPYATTYCNRHCRFSRGNDPAFAAMLTEKIATILADVDSRQVMQGAKPAMAPMATGPLRFGPGPEMQSQTGAWQKESGATSLPLFQ